MTFSSGAISGGGARHPGEGVMQTFSWTEELEDVKGVAFTFGKHTTAR